MDKFKNFSLERYVSDLLAIAMENKNIVVSILGIVFVGYTMFTTLTDLEINKDVGHFNNLQKEIVITSFDQEVIEEIRNLDEFQRTVNSNFSEERINPFIN